MKKAMKISYLFLLVTVMVSLVTSSCKKDSDDPADPQPTNIKNYAGTTDAGKTIQLSTGEIGSDIYLVSINIMLYYRDGSSTIEEQYSVSISSGILKFTGSSFSLTGQLSGGRTVVITGALVNTDGGIDGTYVWNYGGTSPYNGTYTSVKQ